MEQQHTKSEILTRYLNLVYFGQGAYGIQAAAQRYFSVNAVDLTLPQAAMLAGLVQTPSNDDPLDDPNGRRQRRNQVLQRMARPRARHRGRRRRDRAHTGRRRRRPRPRRTGASTPSRAAFFCDYLDTYLTQTLGIAQDRLEDGGLTIKTTLRPDLQASGDQAVLNHLAMGDPLAGMFTAVEPGTGHVLAMSVNRRFGFDAADPAQESVALNVVASQGAGLHVQGLRRGGGAGRRHPALEHDHHQRSRTSRASTRSSAARSGPRTSSRTPAGTRRR